MNLNTARCFTALVLGMVFLPAKAGLAQLVLFDYDFESAPIGPGIPSPLFPIQGGGDLVLNSEVTDTGGPDGSNSFKRTWDSTNSGEGYTAGFGAFGVGASSGYPLTGGLPGSRNPANYLFEADLQLTGHVSDTPVRFDIVSFDPYFESRFGIDLNNDSEFNGSAQVWDFSVFPTISPQDDDYVHVSFTLDAPNPFADPGVPEPYFDNSLVIFWIVIHDHSGFGNGPNKMLNIDNVRLIFLAPEPSSAALLALGTLAMLLLHRRTH